MERRAAWQLWVTILSSKSRAWVIAELSAHVVVAVGGVDALHKPSQW